MGLALAETLIEYSNTAILYSTKLGILWYALTCGFRLGMAALIGPAIWTGASGEFRCDTVLFGCDNACYNNFMPIGLDKLWQIQLIAALFPSFLFTSYIYLEDGKRRLDAKRRKLEEKSTIVGSDHTIEDDVTVSEASRNTNLEVMKARNEKRKLRVMGKKVVEVVWSKQIRFAFLVHLLCRMCVEVSFFAFSMMIQVNMNNIGRHGADHRSVFAGLFNVPATYYCPVSDVYVRQWCNKNENILCYVNKPTEKKVSLFYMNITCLISMCLTVADFISACSHFCQRKIRSMKHRHMVGQHFAQARHQAPNGRNSLNTGIVSGPNTWNGCSCHPDFTTVGKDAQCSQYLNDIPSRRNTPLNPAEMTGVEERSSEEVRLPPAIRQSVAFTENPKYGKPFSL